MFERVSSNQEKSKKKSKEVQVGPHASVCGSQFPTGKTQNLLLAAGAGSGDAH